MAESGTQAPSRSTSFLCRRWSGWSRVFMGCGRTQQIPGGAGAACGISSGCGNRRTQLSSSRDETAMYRSGRRERYGFSHRRWRMVRRASRQDWRRRGIKALPSRTALRTPPGVSAFGHLILRRSLFAQLRNGSFGSWTPGTRPREQMASFVTFFIRHLLHGNRYAASGYGNLKRRLMD